MLNFSFYVKKGLILEKIVMDLFIHGYFVIITVVLDSDIEDIVWFYCFFTNAREIRN